MGRRTSAWNEQMGQTTSLTRSHSGGSTAQLDCGPSRTQTKNVHGTLRETPQAERDAHPAPVGEASLGVDGAEIPVRHAYAAG